uniref:Uncharacterized protein n=1 Tax=Photinus pyralis TaxID=7054 RepID=A0A1Y1MI41_PHOPY
MFKKDIEEMPNPSFIHQQRYPQLPLKPKHLQQKREETQEPMDDNDGYLSPIHVEPRHEETFLSKYRRASASFEKDTDKPKLPLRGRPLPPLPIQQTLPSNKDDPEEELGDYTPVIEPLPNTPTNEEELPEYTPIEDEILPTTPVKRALPPIPTQQVLVSTPREPNVTSIRRLKPVPQTSDLVAPVKQNLQVKVKALPKPPKELPPEPVSLFENESLIVNKATEIALCATNAEDDYSSDEYDQVGDGKYK